MDVEGALQDYWHSCHYKDNKLEHDGTWVDGRLYQWLSKDGTIETARMKEDTYDHFYPPTKIIHEEDVIAFRSAKVE